MSIFRSTKTVHATTKEQVDTALKSADRVVVEGDDQLLSYALNRAAVDPNNRLSVELDEVSTRLVEPDEASADELLLGLTEPGSDRRTRDEQRLYLRPSLPPAAAAPTAAPKRAPKRGRPILWALASLLVGGGAVIMFSVPDMRSLTALSPRIERGITDRSWASLLPDRATPSRSPEAEPRASAADEVAAPNAGALQSLAWPVVALVAIVGMFLLGYQAIAAGRNVQIEWKVTEKVTGRVVITKVGTPTRKAPRARPSPTK